MRFAFGGSEDAVRAAAMEVNALYCCGPAGGGGVRVHVTPRYVTRSCLVSREAVAPTFAFLAANSAFCAAILRVTHTHAQK